jgi:hypothetical protein
MQSRVDLAEKDLAPFFLQSFRALFECDVSKSDNDELNLLFEIIFRLQKQNEKLNGQNWNPGCGEVLSVTSSTT